MRQSHDLNGLKLQCTAFFLFSIQFACFNRVYKRSTKYSLIYQIKYGRANSNNAFLQQREINYFDFTEFYHIQQKNMNNFHMYLWFFGYRACGCNFGMKF